MCEFRLRATPQVPIVTTPSHIHLLTSLASATITSTIYHPPFLERPKDMPIVYLTTLLINTNFFYNLGELESIRGLEAII